MSTQSDNKRDDTQPKIVYTAMPKYIGVMDPYIGTYVYNNDCVPITPWMYPFWLLDSVDRDAIRNANERYIDVADEVWVFSTESGVFNDAVATMHGIDIHDGVFREIEQATARNMPIRFHELDHDTQSIVRVESVTNPAEALHLD